MYKFGKIPRSLESFGVAGLLNEGCKVYYNSLFSPRAIGRVGDLLVAQLQRPGIALDELGFRNLLAECFYNAFRFQLGVSGQGGILTQPLTIECGVDSEKLAIGVAFSCAEGSELHPEELAQEISSKCDQVVLRIDGPARRVELVAMFSLGGADESEAGVEIVLLKPGVKPSTVTAQYIELGDLDYARLLEEQGPGASTEAPATGEILARQGAPEPEPSSNVQGSEAAKPNMVRISGVTQHLGEGVDTEVTVVTDRETRPAKDASASERELETARKQVEMYRARVTELQSKLAKIEKQRQTEEIVVTSRAEALAQSQAPSEKAAEPPQESDEASQGAKRGATFKEIIQNLWPFSRGSKPETELAPQKPAEQPLSPQAAEAAEADAADPETGRLLRDQVENLQKTIERIQHESENLKKELGNGRAKKWAEGMVGDLLSEKARLNELSKKLNVTLRQKELSFKNKELSLEEALRRKDEQLKQKTYALERAKEQLSQAAMSLERSRLGSTVASEETQFRQKLQFTQKLLASAKEENLVLSRRIEEVRGQLAIAQSAAKAKLQRDLEYDTMRSKYEKLMRQADEFKRANHQLLEKFAEMERQKPAGNPEDLKKKLEAAMRLAATHQKDSELLRSRVEDMQKSEARLKAELGRATAALRALKASGTGGPGSGGSEAA